MVSEENVRNGIKITVNGASNVPGCVPGVVPAANIICGLSRQTAQTSSVVAYNPVWNHCMEFSSRTKKGTVLFILRDADQLLGSLQVTLKSITPACLTTKPIYMVDKYKDKQCNLSFTITFDDRIALARKKLLEKFKSSVLLRFGSDPALNISTDSEANTSGTKKSALSCEPSRNVLRPIQRCHSYVNSRGSALLRHQYVNTSKQRFCGELRKHAAEIYSPRSTEEKRMLVLIQGRNLGESTDDVVSIYIGGVDCTTYSEHITPEKLLVRVPHGTSLSPVSVVTKSGGVGQQNAKVKVTYSCRGMKRFSPEGSSDTSPSNALPSSLCMSGTSESGSDNMSVNTRSKPTFTPRSSSTSSLYSIEWDNSSRDVTEPTSCPGSRATVILPDIIPPPRCFSVGSAPFSLDSPPLAAEPTAIPSLAPQTRVNLAQMSKTELVEMVLKLQSLT